MKISRAIIPGLVTAGNLFMGFFSVINTFGGRIVTACWCIVIAAVLDALDGKIARLAKASSRFGVEYDSLADVVSFGFAPSILIYFLFYQSMGFPTVLFAFLPLLCGSLRLARFNIQLSGFDKKYFTGLPIPSAAILIGSFVIFSMKLYAQPLPYPELMMILVAAVSLLMISTIRYELMPNLINKFVSNTKLRLTLNLAVVAVLLLFPQKTLFPLMLVYMLSGIAAWLFRLIFDSNKGESSLESKS